MSELDRKPGTQETQLDSKAARRVTLPGFVDEEIGLGDLIKRATETLGIKPCADCQKRAAVLNQWLRFSGKRPE